MKSRKIFICILTLILLVMGVFAQPCVCPGKITVDGSAGLLKAGESAFFTARVEGDKGQSTYAWRVSAGEIIQGQGTPVIKVETKGFAGQSVTATVEIGGWCAECKNTNSSVTARL